MKTINLKTYQLYDFLPSGNCYKIRLLLNQLGIEYERINVDLLNKESRTKEFLKINPNGRTPVLYHDGQCLAESNAILWYLIMSKRWYCSGCSLNNTATNPTSQLHAIGFQYLRLKMSIRNS